MSAEKPEIRISEKDKIDGFPVPNGWGKSRVSDHWYLPGGPWHGYEDKIKYHDMELILDETLN